MSRGNDEDVILVPVVYRDFRFSVPSGYLEYFRHARFVTLERAGHAVFEAAELAEALETFVRDI